ncbi:MAG TPA: N-6 DNA methylase, partial [Acidimicrobiales bacterium]|nr:N-6 DNA methylase [Acidimicrobiales bacterium]
MDARPVLAGLARTLFLRDDVRGDEVALLDADGVDGFPPMPDSATSDLLGLAHEALLAPADRKARGAHYTPPALADRLVALTLPPRPERVLDPACGGGAFLLASARAGVPELCGVELDPL